MKNLVDATARNDKEVKEEGHVKKMILRQNKARSPAALRGQRGEPVDRKGGISKGKKLAHSPPMTYSLI